MVKTNGYNISKHCDADYWDTYDYVTMTKLFDDDSFDFLCIDHIPKEFNSLDEYINQVIENRSDDKIIQSHYDVLLSHLQDWDREPGEQIIKSLDAYSEGDFLTAYKLLNSLNKLKDITIEFWAESLRKHLSRIIIGN